MNRLFPVSSNQFISKSGVAFADMPLRAEKGVVLHWYVRRRWARVVRCVLVSVLLPVEL